MKGTNFKTNFLTSFVLIGVMSLGACAKLAKPGDGTNTRGLGGTHTDNETPTRECTDIIYGSTASRLRNFFFPDGSGVVRNLEGPPTFCLSLEGQQNSTHSQTPLVGTLRIEYEDDFGIRYYVAGTESTYYSKLTDINDELLDLEIIFADHAGFIQITASEDPDEGIMKGTIKYYNFPSYAEALTQAAQEAAEKCKNGTYTTAYCLGFQSPANSIKWWEDPNYLISPEEQLLKAAQAILNDPEKTRTLGTISFDLSDVF